VLGSPPNSHRSPRRDDPPHIGLCQPSNPHSAAPLLISSARPRGFLPGGLSNTCPQALPGLDSSARNGSCRTTLTQAASGRRPLCRSMNKPSRESLEPIVSGNDVAKGTRLRNENRSAVRRRKPSKAQQPKILCQTRHASRRDADNAQH